MFCDNSIIDVTTTIKNSQSYAICEQRHQSFSNMLQTMLHPYPPDNIEYINDSMDFCFVTTAYAFMVATQYTLNMSPVALVLQIDKMLNLPLKTRYFNYFLLLFCLCNI